MSEDSGMTIAEFLEARISEDEYSSNRELLLGTSMTLTRLHSRILDECAAKRAILNLHQRMDYVQRMVYGDIYPCTECGSVDDSPVEWPCPTLKAIASVYKDHPDYQQEWGHGDARAS
jgi:hypothetical protein